MSFCPEIKLLKGFCNLNFGESLADAEKLFGAPNESENLEDDILNASTCVLHYWDSGFSLFFDNHKNKIFNSAEVDNPEAMLLGEKVFSLKEHQLIALLKLNGYALTDTEHHEWGEKRISFDDANLDCYFENGKLTSINFGVSEINSNFQFLPN